MIIIFLFIFFVSNCQSAMLEPVKLDYEPEIIQIHSPINTRIENVFSDDQEITPIADPVIQPSNLAQLAQQVHVRTEDYQEALQIKEELQDLISLLNFYKEQDPNYCPILAADIADARIIAQQLQEALYGETYVNHSSEVTQTDSPYQAQLTQISQEIQQVLHEEKITHDKKLMEKYLPYRKRLSYNMQYLQIALKTIADGTFCSDNITPISPGSLMIQLIDRYDIKKIDDPTDPLTALTEIIHKESNDFAAQAKSQQPTYSLLGSAKNKLTTLGKAAFYKSNVQSFAVNSYVKQLNFDRQIGSLNKITYSERMRAENQIISTVIHEPVIKTLMSQGYSIHSIAEKYGFTGIVDVQKDINSLEKSLAAYKSSSYERLTGFISQYRNLISDRYDAETLRAFNRNLNLGLEKIDSYIQCINAIKNTIEQQDIGSGGDSIQEKMLVVDRSLHDRQALLVLEHLLLEAEDIRAIIIECRNVNNISINASKGIARNLVSFIGFGTQAAVNVIHQARVDGQAQQDAVNNFANQQLTIKPAHNPQIDQLFRNFSEQYNQDFNKALQKSHDQFLIKQNPILWAQKTRELTNQGPDFCREERLRALDQVVTSSGKNSLVVFHGSNIDGEHLQSLGISFMDLNTTLGNAFQNQLNKENFELVAKLVQANEIDPVFKQVTPMVASLIKQALAANREGNIEQCRTYTDLAHRYCNAICDVASGAAQKLVDHAPELIAAGGVAATAVAVAELAPALATYGAGRGAITVMSMLASSAQKQAIPTATKALSAALFGRTATKVTPKKEAPRPASGAQIEKSVKISTVNQHIYHTKEDSTKTVKAPGIPTEKDGFIPPKNWDGKKARHPRTGQIGYPDKNGDVWVPTGTGPLAHGGPHWDVVSKDGKKYRNVMPGGHIRGEKK